MIALIVGLLFGFVFAVPAGAAVDLTNLEFHQHPGAQLPMDMTLRNETGKLVQFRNAIANRPTILVLGYFHCPNLCGVVRGDVLNALSQSGLRPDQYSLIVFSIDPAETSRDAASAKQQDHERFPMPGTDIAWHYLTGGARAVAQAVGFPYRYDPRLKQYLHPAGLVLLSPQGRVSGYLLGVGYSPGDLAADVTRAGAGGIAEAASPVLLLCFHSDPTTGRYSLAITKVLQLAGVLTVLTLGVTIGLALRRERSK